MTRHVMTVRWVHRRTGAEALEVVEIDLVSANRIEAEMRLKAWDQIAEISKRLRPMGYEARWS